MAREPQGQTRRSRQHRSAPGPRPIARQTLESGFQERAPSWTSGSRDRPQPPETSAVPFTVDLLCELLELLRYSYHEYRRRLKEQRRGRDKERALAPRWRLMTMACTSSSGRCWLPRPFIPKACAWPTPGFAAEACECPASASTAMRRADLLSPQRIAQ